MHGPEFWKGAIVGAGFATWLVMTLLIWLFVWAASDRREFR